MRVLLTGCDGQLATALHGRLRSSHDVVALSRSELDVTDHARVLDTVQRHVPDVVINGAAYNDVDRAEDESMTALAVNALAVRSLSQAADAAGATLVHFSTDFVFDGVATSPYTELSPPNPRSVYAMSKLLGEWFAVAGARHYVLRVESLFGGVLSRSGSARARGSSVDRMADAILGGREVRAFEDRVVSPSFVDDVTEATMSLVTTGAPFGLYHCVGSGMGTWVDVANELATHLDTPARIVPVAMADVTLRAERPLFCALSNAKLAEAGIVMPSWQDAIRRYAAARLAAVISPSRHGA